ncbi:hypothetical protein RMN57_34400 [Kitasatospora sp. CM 4170]|uniref:Uncharacterized protein n=1 Tax=Kitasatospora aburaviensis TaxID=67265 RepID=A0ABW1F1P6_9ACTN|nr:hypothetical protein [Kitasatospora sp. CM 4170]WNM49425.1 hypothetical protein RMN57_34400 [Kitasatospora sp. CM 4170]
MDKTVAHVNFNPVMKGVDAKQFPTMASLDPYGDTVLNYLQCGFLIGELREGAEFLAASGVDEDAVQNLVRMCELVRAKPHRHLVFIGD